MQEVVSSILTGATTMKNKLLFTDRAAPFVLEGLGYRTDAEGYITKNGERVLATDGNEIKLSDLGGIYKGGIFRKDLYSIMLLVDNERLNVRKIN